MIICIWKREKKHQQVNNYFLGAMHIVSTMWFACCGLHFKLFLSKQFFFWCFEVISWHCRGQAATEDWCWKKSLVKFRFIFFFGYTEKSSNNPLNRRKYFLRYFQHWHPITPSEGPIKCADILWAIFTDPFCCSCHLFDFLQLGRKE
jgi:hypothetical protein